MIPGSTIQSQPSPPNGNALAEANKTHALYQSLTSCAGWKELFTPLLLKRIREITHDILENPHTGEEMILLRERRLELISQIQTLNACEEAALRVIEQARQVEESKPRQFTTDSPIPQDFLKAMGVEAAQPLDASLKSELDQLFSPFKTPVQ